jgi:hypothetical protein
VQQYKCNHANYLILKNAEKETYFVYILNKQRRSESDTLSLNEGITK